MDNHSACSNHFASNNMLPEAKILSCRNPFVQKPTITQETYHHCRSSHWGRPARSSPRQSSLGCTRRSGSCTHPVARVALLQSGAFKCGATGQHNITQPQHECMTQPQQNPQQRTSGLCALALGQSTGQHDTTGTAQHPQCSVAEHTQTGSARDLLAPTIATQFITGMVPRLDRTLKQTTRLA